MADITEGAGERASRELERERLLAAVQAREEFLEDILGSLEAFLTVDADWRVTFANDCAAELIGLSAERAEGFDLRASRRRPDSGDEASRLLRRAMSDRVPVEFDLHDLAPGRVFRGRASPLDDGGLAVYLRDVTETLRAEEAVRESEELLQTVLAHSRDGINMLDLRTGRYVYMNDAQVALTGFTAEEINEITAEEAYDRVHPDDRAISVEQQRQVREGEDVDEPVEYRWKVKSGEYRWFSDRRKIVRDAHGTPVALVGISTDITDQKRSHAVRERQTFVVGGIASILEAALTVQSEERLGEICLQVAELLTGSESGFIGEIGADGSLRDLALSDADRHPCAVEDRCGHRGPPDDLGLYGLCGHVLRTGEPLMTNDPSAHLESIDRSDGHPPLTSFLGAPLKRGERVIGLVAVADRPGGYDEEQLQSLQAVAPVIGEVIQRRRAEEALRENELLNAAQLERNRLARDLHDSVTQALFAATIKAEALTLGDDAPPAVAATAEEVRRLTRGALAQMRTLLLELRAEPVHEVPLRQLLRHLVEATESRTSTDLRLVVRGDGEVPPAVHAMLYRVAQEALNNVARHAHAARAWVELDLAASSARLVVGDDGVGFEAEGEPAGHLGLVSMRERAAEAGATLRLTSTAGRGSELVVEWHAGDEDADDGDTGERDTGAA